MNLWSKGEIITSFYILDYIIDHFIKYSINLKTAILCIYN